ncbi:MAG TPA: triose-phosphate isomerase [Thermoanaerobaculia bacterium]|jgi:triosephosphate isomerase|nr:triose-phosphate isomerase [Thermoanaerobaculia bacterium]
MSDASRRLLAAANWKMHLLRAEARTFCDSLRAAPADGVEVAIFPSFPLLPAVAEALAGTPFAVGGQDLHSEDAGAHTGDVSGAQLADAGCGWVLVGHSERRRDHGEDDALVARKLAAAVRHGLRPILCLGETGDERRAGETFAVLERQLSMALTVGWGRPLPLEGQGDGGIGVTSNLGEGVGRVGAARFARGGGAIAYEPVWAIGTGDVATPEQAQEAHAFLRARLAELGSPALAASLRLLYGGSVKPDNAAELIAQPDVDGFLVGGASLDAGKFLAIIHACARR